MTLPVTINFHFMKKIQINAMTVNNEWVCQSLESCRTSLFVSLKNFIRVWNNMSEYIRFLFTVTVSLLKLFSQLCFHVWPQDGNVGLSNINHASPVSDSLSPKHFHDLFSFPQITDSLSRYSMHKICRHFSCCHNHYRDKTLISQFPITSNWDGKQRQR